jgi:hypothetical protein
VVPIGTKTLSKAHVAMLESKRKKRGGGRKGV